VDFIEIQMGHGYLIHQFYSPRLNKRNDKYGGSLENRLNFAREVLQIVKSSAENIPIIVRLSASEFIEGGITPEDLKPLIEILENENVAALHLGFGNACDNPAWYYQHMALPEEPKIEVTKKIRKMTKLPLILVGRMIGTERIEDLLSDDIVDIVAIARPLIVDPYTPVKIISKNENGLKCGACLQGCLMNVKSGRPIGCIMNPKTDVFEEPEKSEISKKVLVIGGGPAGMVASLTLVERGYDVILVEATSELGGQFKYAYLAPGKQRMKPLLESLINMVERSVKVIKNKVVDIGFIKEISPDYVLIATGAEPLILNFEGLDSINWIVGIEALERDDITGKRVLVVGGGLIGMEVAEKLIEHGNTVDVVEIREKVAIGMEPITEKLMWKRLEGKPINIYTQTAIQAFKPGGTVVKDLKSDEIKILGSYDIVIMATGTVPKCSLVDDVKNAGIPFEIIGDARELKQIIGAVKNAYAVASTL